MTYIQKKETFFACIFNKKNMEIRKINFFCDNEQKEERDQVINMLLRRREILI